MFYEVIDPYLMYLKITDFLYSYGYLWGSRGVH